MVADAKTSTCDSRGPPVVADPLMVQHFVLGNLAARLR